MGYSLSHAYGAAFDNPDLIVACVVGDGEAETGALATSWHSNKFLNPATDGAVLPILHLNGYKIASPTVLARISHEELDQLFRGYGYTPYFVEGHEPEKMHQLMAATLDRVIDEIKQIQTDARGEGERRPAALAHDRVAHPEGLDLSQGDRRQAHGRLLALPPGTHGRDAQNPAHVKILEQWMKSYKPEELFDKNGRLKSEIAELPPKGERRMSANPHTNGGILLKELRLPDFRDLCRRGIRPGDGNAEATRVRDVSCAT